VGLLQPQLEPDVRRRLASVLETVADSTADARIRVETRQIVIQLSSE
jgi:hypothetical protein